MPIKGTVVGYHATLPRFAIKTADGYTVLDVEAGQLAPHHEVTGQLNSLGHATITNESTGEDVDVYIEAVKAGRHAANLLLRG